MSDPSVCVGCDCVRNTALERKWSPPISSGLYASAMRTSVLLMIVRYLRHDSSGESDVLLRSKLLPVVGGAHRCSVSPNGAQPAAPCTISSASSRVGFAARSAEACAERESAAGVIASR